MKAPTQESKPLPPAVAGRRGTRFTSGSFAIIRSGIADHLIAGELGFLGLGIYTTIHLHADFRTGICRTSAPRLHATAPRGISLRDIQREIENLTRIRFLRPFHVQGARGNYPVLIHKYEVKLGALRGKRLNAWNSESWSKPVYESCAEDDSDTAAETDAESVAEDAPIHESGTRKEELEGSGSDLRFSLDGPTATTVLSPQTIKCKQQTARTILIAEGGVEPDLVDVALLRVVDLARALKKTPHSVAYFVTSVKNSLADPDEAEQCRSIAAERRRSGVPIDAPLRPDEWHVRSRIALVQDSVEVAVRDDRDTRVVQAEMVAAIDRSWVRQ
jgi:hypothetical protein